MDKSLRNTLRNTVTQCRKLLEDSISELLQGQFGIHKDGKIEDESYMGHLSDEDRDYREKIIIHLEHIAGGDKVTQKKNAEALSQLVREVAFTHLNRLCAYKMLEVRKLIRESVSRGINSNNFKFYLADYPEEEKLWATGKQDIVYRHFLVWLGSTLTDEIGVLFSPLDPANRLFPHHRALEEILELLNNNELSDIWQEDETIGWIYQYFTPRELRDKVRKESAAPRNSYELAFRNQFYTPRYVVEFLADNTLGRIWYEMKKGETVLSEICRYLVKRPEEIFLSPGEKAPEIDKEPSLQDPVYIPHREKKDPRDIKILDPACGSGHFLLYCFDLLEIIYREAYEDETFPPFTETGKALIEDYPDKEIFNYSFPGLILRHNLHGIDIDLRATQIASLALWLRVQKSYQEMNLKKNERPKITKSNIVCAEPMPGQKELLDEFVSELKPAVLGQLVRVVFDKMTLAGEAGSLLKIEEEISEAVGEARKQWLSQPKAEQLALFQMDKPSKDISLFTQMEFDLSDITDETFWNDVETRVIEALREYAEKASNGKGYLRKLFSEDAAHGFAFIDICHKRFDVVLMNPPFGESSKVAKTYIDKNFIRSKHNLACTFVDRWLTACVKGGKLGAITTRTPFFIFSNTKWREEIILSEGTLDVFLDLGLGVLEAMVETSAYVISNKKFSYPTIFFRLIKDEKKETSFIEILQNVKDSRRYIVKTNSFFQIPNSPLCYWVSESVRRLFEILPKVGSHSRYTLVGAQTSNDFRFIRLWWEVLITTEARSREETMTGKRWVPLAKGGSYSPYYTDIHLVINWVYDGKEIKEWVVQNATDPATTHWSRRVANSEYYFCQGLTWTHRTTLKFSIRILPKGCIFGLEGPSLFTDYNYELRILLLIMHSSMFQFLIDTCVGAADAAARTHDVGVIKRIPIPNISNTNVYDSIIDSCIKSKIKLVSCNETSRVFILPSILQGKFLTLMEGFKYWQKIREDIEFNFKENQKKIDEISFTLYGIDPQDKASIITSITDLNNKPKENCGDNEDTESTMDNLIFSVQSLISWCFGVTVGRFDIRLATGERLIPELGDPFDPLPIYSPGMLEKEPEHYPFKIDRDGILPDDENHSDDIVRRIREVLYLLWKDTSDEIEQEACQILNVKTLREYFRKPKGGFVDDHIKRYSKSRRKAPIYWLLQSSKKNYSLWLYYHRIDRDILFKALENYVRPKINHEENRLMELRNQKAGFEPGSKEVRTIEKEIDKEEAFISELVDFKEKLERAAKLYLEPDLNDGVVLNIAPLWELVPWGEAKKYWNELMEGKYEWSSIGKQLREKGFVK